MATKRRCAICGRIQRVAEGAVDSTCDGCGGQLRSVKVRRTAPGLGRRFLAVGMMVVGMILATSFVLVTIRRAPFFEWDELREGLFFGLVIPALLIIGGVTLAKGMIETLPAESMSERGTSLDRPEGSAAFWDPDEAEGDSLLGRDVPLTP